MEFKTRGIDELLTDLLCTIKLLKIISAILLIAFLTTLLVHINTKDKIIEKYSAPLVNTC